MHLFDTTISSDGYNRILYPLFILLLHNLCQLPFSPRSAGRDTDALATIMIVITSPFRWVGHCCRRRRH